MGENWDAKAFGAHKIHAKTLVIDPWGDDPAVLIGSANFSRPSCTKNDENTLLIRGDKRVAAMVAVEFIRMYEHYRSRFWIKEIAEEQKKHGTPPNNSSWFLKDDDSWSRTSFDASVNSRKFRDRVVFSGGT
jgi:phosphatidylserine/phosphatidylglycerophosphate/cardiolipin synthase-like enzyme